MSDADKCVRCRAENAMQSSLPAARRLNDDRKPAKQTNSKRDYCNVQIFLLYQDALFVARVRVLSKSMVASRYITVKGTAKRVYVPKKKTEKKNPDNQNREKK